MKVAYVTLAPFISGAERSLQAMLTHARSAGIDPVVLCPPASAIIPWCDANQITYEEAVLPERDRRHPFRWWLAVWRLVRVLKRQRIDLVHSNQVWCYAAVGTAAGRLGIPRVCHMRDEVALDGVRWWCRSGVEAVISISGHIDALVRPAWSGTSVAPRFATMLNPILAPATTSAGPRQRPALDFQRPPDTTVFGFVGQLAPVKGVLELLDALHQMKTVRPWHLLVAGRDPHPNGDYQARCLARVNELALQKHVTFVGFLDDLDPFYESIDVAVVPSLREPLGRVPLEAARHAKPAVAFATGGLVETIVNGHTGWLVPPGDIPALSASLEAITNGRHELPIAGAAARRFVTDACDPSGYMRALRALYDGLQPARHRVGVEHPSVSHGRL